MFSVKVILFFFLTLLAIVQAAPRPPSRPPARPCKYACPRSDNGRNRLQGSNDRGSSLTCSYGRNKSCVYGLFTGQLTRDNNRRKCPRQANNPNRCGRDNNHHDNNDHHNNNDHHDNNQHDNNNHHDNNQHDNNQHDNNQHDNNQHDNNQHHRREVDDVADDVEDVDVGGEDAE